MRRPLFPTWGRRIITLLCGYELVALYSPLPPITHVCRRWRLAGVALVLALAHHLFIEDPNFVRC